MQLEDLKPRFYSLPAKEQMYLIEKIQKSRMTIKEAKTPKQKSIQKKVRTKTKREKLLGELIERYNYLKSLNEGEVSND